MDSAHQGLYPSQYFHKFPIETRNVEGHGQIQGLHCQWIVLIKAYEHIHIEIVTCISSSFPTIDINANLHLTFKLETLKVKDQDCNGWRLTRCILT